LLPELTWRLTPGQALRYRQWQGESVLYNDLSGDTHLLADASLHVLLQLQAGPAAQSALAASVRAEFDADDGEVDDTAVAELLDELHALVLIEQAA
jgi:PqqD family protein of HPr-rel-A system